MSFCAALVNLIDSSEEGLTGRIIAIGVFSVLYLAFSILFGIALQGWDDQTLGRCYVTTNISASGAAHPYVDHIYLAVTCLFLFVILIAALPPLWDLELPWARGFKIRNLTNIPMLLERFKRSGRSRRYATLHSAVTMYLQIVSIVVGVASAFGNGVAYSIVGGFRLFVDDTVWDELAEQKKQIAVICPLLFQYPLHLYMVLTMRRWNSGLLDGDSEDAWGFGQVVALVLLAPTLLMCIQAIFSKLRRLCTKRNSVNATNYAKEYRRIGRNNSDEPGQLMTGVSVLLDETTESRKPRGRAVSI